MKNSKNQNRY